jgi:hypothetical protein
MNTAIAASKPTPVCIMQGPNSTVQGELVQRLLDGRVTVKVGPTIFTGKLVSQK